MSKTGRGVRLGVVLLLAVFIAVGAAQTIVSGDLNGGITDPTGAVVLGALVKLTSLDTGMSQSTITDSSGVYRFSLVKPGDYTLLVSQSGFMSTVQKVTIGVGQAVTANLTLQLGQETETVEVMSLVPLLQTEGANLSTLISSTQLEHLPNGGNDLTAFAENAPGILQNTSSGGKGNFTAFGLPATSNLFTIDGNDEMDAYLNLNNSGASNLLLGSGAVSEVAVVTNGYGGQYGRMAGAQVNYVTKSGSNQTHGAAKYWWNGSSLNANDWFNNHFATPLPFENNNQYEAQIGGPIVRDKLFFFVGTEGLRYILGTSNQVYIPGPDFQRAVLANLPEDGAPNSVPFYAKIFDIMNGAPGASLAEPVDDKTALNGGCGDFANHTLGTTTFGSSAQGLTPCATTFRSTAGALSTEWLLYAKVDWVRSAEDRWAIFFKSDHGFQPTYTDPVNTLFDVTSSQPEYEGRLNNTHSFSSRLVNQSILSGFWYGSFFKNANAAEAHALFPYSITDLDSPFGTPQAMVGGLAGYPQGRDTTQYQIVDDLTFVHGNHSLKFGGTFRRDDVTDGSFGVLTTPRMRILSTQSFVLGKISQTSQRFPKRLTEPIAFYSLGVYSQDEWRVTTKFNLTFTLRADHNSNPVCQTDCFSRLATQYKQLNHDVTIPFNQMIETSLHSAFPQLQKISLQPRVGFAYSVYDDTVIRGGIGMFSDLYPGFLADNFASQAPLNPQFTLGTRFLSPDEPASAESLVQSCNTSFANTFDAGGTLADFTTAAPKGCKPPDYHDVASHVKNPIYVEWNLQFQHALGQTSAISLNYVGNHGYNEFIYNNLTNAWDPAGKSGLPTSVVDARLGTVQTLSNGATSNYHGLTASFTQHSIYGLQFSVSYTWSHAIDAVSNGGIEKYALNDSLAAAVNPFNLRAQNYGSADYDVRHNFTANYIWQIPTSFKGWRQKMLGAWTLSQTFFARSAYPFTVQDTSNPFQLATGFGVGVSPLPTYVGAKLTCNNPTVPCFTISQFPDAGAENGFGTQRRNSFRGPDYFNSDLSLRKAISIKERVSLSLGLTGYNIFNHPNFANPSHDAGTPDRLGLIQSTVVPSTSPYGAFVGSAVSGRLVQLQAGVQF